MDKLVVIRAATEVGSSLARAVIERFPASGVMAPQQLFGLPRTMGRQARMISMASPFQNDDLRRPDPDDGVPPDEVTVGNPYHLSRGTRTFLQLVSLVLVFTMTALFLKGFIHT